MVLMYNKVPCNSGLPLDRVEADKPTQQAVETLIELSQGSIDVVAWTLADMLHTMAKVSFAMVIQ